jgi:hypothetical protein
MVTEPRRHSSTSNRDSVVMLLPLIATLLAPQFSAAQSSSQCHVRVVHYDVIVSTDEWYDVAHHVLPAGVVQNPDAWPYFAWSDTSHGVVRALDGPGYLFFGSDGGCHENCNGKKQRWGSVTVSHGTLDHPLGFPVDDPNPQPYEFTFPNTKDITPSIDYAGGGPVYRVTNAEPGAGSLLLVYHTEQPANPFYSRTRIAKSTDEGITWQDLGTILTVPHPYDPTSHRCRRESARALHRPRHPREILLHLLPATLLDQLPATLLDQHHDLQRLHLHLRGQSLL